MHALHATHGCRCPASVSPRPQHTSSCDRIQCGGPRAEMRGRKGAKTKRNADTKFHRVSAAVVVRGPQTSPRAGGGCRWVLGWRVQVPAHPLPPQQRQAALVRGGSRSCAWRGRLLPSKVLGTCPHPREGLGISLLAEQPLLTLSHGSIKTLHPHKLQILGPPKPWPSQIPNLWPYKAQTLDLTDPKHLAPYTPNPWPSSPWPL